MKPLDETLKLEELVLPQNEDEDVEIYADEGPNEELFDDVSGAFPFTDITGTAPEEQIDEGDRFVESLPHKWAPIPTDLKDLGSQSQNWSSVVSTPCGHLYHLGCIHSWMEHLEKRGWEPTCAYCRHVIYNSMELIPIFPVSVKDEDSDGEFSDKNSRNPHSLKTREVCPNEIQVEDATSEKLSTSPHEEDATTSEVNLCFVALLVLFTLCFYLGYVNNCMETLDSEDNEDSEVDPVFGTTWTVLVTITFAIALMTDLFYSANWLHANNNR
jgi:hypothetical protein